jgi:HPt (histidine-containing phosphotransfer) domain-containing protein
LRLPRTFQRFKPRAVPDERRSIRPGSYAKVSSRESLRSKVDDNLMNQKVNSDPEAGTEPPPDPADWPALLTSIEGDEGFARELVNAYIATGNQELAAIAAALRAGNTAKVRESAHTLKGASLNVRASATISAAARLEVAANSGEHAQLPTLAEQLKTAVEQTMKYLQTKVT